MNDDLRRRLIGFAGIALFALAIVVLPGGGEAVDVASAAFQAAFIAVIALAFSRLYRSRTDWLSELPDRDRAILYGAVATAVLAIVAVGRFKSFDGGIAVLVLVLAGCGFACFGVWRRSQDFSY